MPAGFSDFWKMKQTQLGCATCNREKKESFLRPEEQDRQRLRQSFSALFSHTPTIYYVCVLVPIINHFLYFMQRFQA